MIDLKKKIAAGYEATSRKSWPTYDGGYLDRSKFMTSSEAANCSRRIKYRQTYEGKTGFPNWGYAERGNIIETWVVSMLRASGMEVLNVGADQVSYYDEAQSGTPDGLVKWFDGYLLLEFKSVDPRTNYSNLPRDYHIAQVQQNMDLVQHCMDKPVYGGILLYVDASDLQKTKQIDLEPDLEMQQRLQRKARAIRDAASPADLPNEGMFMPGGCDRCEFTDQCSALVAGDMKHVERASANVFK